MLGKLISFKVYFHIFLKVNVRFLDQRKLFPAITSTVPLAQIFLSFGAIQKGHMCSSVHTKASASQERNLKI